MELNPVPFNGSNFEFCYCNVCGIRANLYELSTVSKSFDIVLCSETLVSVFRHASVILIPGCVTLSVRPPDQIT